MVKPEEETFDEKDIVGKEMNLYDLQLMALIMDPHTKENTSITSRARRNKARLLPKDKCTHTCATIKLSERIQLK